jgi:hypothetical protein
MGATHAAWVTTNVCYQILKKQIRQQEEIKTVPLSKEGQRGGALLATTMRN